MLDEVQGGVSLEQTNRMLDEALARKRAKHHVSYATVRGRAAHLVRNARLRALSNGEPMELTIDWAEEKLKAGICEKTGILFDMRTTGIKGPRNMLAPSIDQITPGLGYTVANSRMVIWLYNRAKGLDADHHVLSMAYALVAKHQSAIPSAWRMPIIQTPDRAIVMPMEPTP